MSIASPLMSCAVDNIREPEFSMKTSFLENLLICKKAPGDESAKENVKMHQNENRTDLVNRNLRRDGQLLKSVPMRPPSKVRLVQFPLKANSLPVSDSESPSKPVTQSEFAPLVTGKSRTHYTGNQSLLGKNNFGGFENMKRPNLRSLLTGHSLTPPPAIPPLAPLTRIVATLPDVPRAPLKPSPCTSRQLQNSRISASNSSGKKNTSQDDDVQIIETPSSRLPPHQPGSSKPCQEPSILVGSSAYPRVSRRKQSLAMRRGCCDPLETETANVTTDDDGLPREGSGSTTANPSSSKDSTPEAGDSCSSPKKQKVASETSESSRPPTFPNPQCGKPRRLNVLPPKKPDDKVYTIVLTDSSDEERPVEKAPPAKPSAAKSQSPKKKYTPVLRSALRNSKGRACKAVLSKSNSVRSRRSDAIVDSSKHPVAVKRVPKRTNSLCSRNSRNVGSVRVSDSSEEISSDEDEAPRYVSRTGRSVGVSAGCRSCPGCKVDRSRKEKPKLKPAKKKRKPEPMTPSHYDVSASENESYTDVFHAGSEEHMDAFQTPESPPTVIMHGLTSSESSDEELLAMLEGGRTALVFVPDEDSGECKASPSPNESARECKDSPSRREAAKEVSGTHVPSPVIGVAGSRVNSLSGSSDHIGPDDGVPARFSEGPVSSPNAFAYLEGSGLGKTHIPQTSENSRDVAEEALSSAVPVKNGNETSGASFSQIPVDSKPLESQSVKTDMDDLPNSPHSASEVQCYLSHHDSNGTLLLHEVNSDSSEEGIPRDCGQPEVRHNEKLGDDGGVLLADDSSETSGGSSAVLNFDSQEYTECESACSSRASSPHDGSCREVGVPPEGQVCGSDSCNAESSSLGVKLCSPSPFPEGDTQRSDAALEDPPNLSLNSPEHGSEKPCAAQEDKLADSGQTFDEDLPPERGPVNVTEACRETQDCRTPGEPSLDVALPREIQIPQGEVSSTGHCSEKIHPFDQDGLNTSECQSSARDTITSLADSASHGNARQCELSSREAGSVLYESLEDSSMVLDTSLVNNVAGKTDGVQMFDRGDGGRQDGSMQVVGDQVPPENVHSFQERVICNNHPSLRLSSKTITEAPNVLQDSPDEPDAKSGTMLQSEASKMLQSEAFEVLQSEASNMVQSEALEPLQSEAAEMVQSEASEIVQNEASETVVADQGCQKQESGRKVLEIQMLEGCPSCQCEYKKTSSTGNVDGRKDIRTENSACHDSADNQAPPERPSSLGDPPECLVAEAQGRTFYHAVSNLLIDCLNNMVESVKLDNREVIIKKVDPELPDTLEMDPVAHEAGLAAEDLESILKELNLPVSLNPRLTIKKLPSIPRQGTCEINSAPRDSTAHESSDDCASNNGQVPENPCPGSNTTPTRSFYDRKGYPTPIKRLDPRVLSVIKYDDLEIYNDEPSLNDPPESDRVECVSSKGVRLELNPEELANIENLLNTKISHLRDSCKQSSTDEGDAKSFEIDELVIYNDEPPLNLTPVRRLKCPLPSHDDEDLDELVIDNDAPPLNEPADDAPLRNVPLDADPASKPALNDSECMVISSDDEVAPTSGLPAEAIAKLLVAPDVNSKPVERPRKKLFRKRRNPANPVEAPSVIDLQKSQMALRGEDRYDCFEAGNQCILDLSVLECSGDDVIDEEVIIDDSDVETFGQPFRKPLPALQSCREVLHQPQVFNRQGQALLHSSGRFIGSDLAVNSKATGCSQNAQSASQATFDLSETFEDSRETGCVTISDTETALECEDEVIVVSPPKTSHVERFIGKYKNGCDTKDVVQNVDTDSDDDVIVMSGPDDFPPVNNRFQRFQSPVAPPSLANRINVRPQVRNAGFAQSNRFPQTRRSLPAQLDRLGTRQFTTYRTPNGNSYVVLVVPPNERQMNPRR